MISQRRTLAGVGIVVAATVWTVVPAGRPPAATASTAGAAQDVIRRTGSGRTAGTGFDIGTPLTNQELASQAALIVIGQAGESKSHWTDDGRNLFTLVNIAVDDTLKGDQGSITVALPGGVDAARKFPIAMTYPGAPRIFPDEEVFLFLSRADDEITRSPGSRRASSRSRPARAARSCARRAPTSRCEWRTGWCSLVVQGRNREGPAVAAEEP